jgi:hypothetical protein
LTCGFGIPGSNSTVPVLLLLLLLAGSHCLAVGKILLFTDSTVQSDSTVQLYNYEYSKIPGYQDIDTGTAYMKITPRGKSGNMDYLFPPGALSSVRISVSVFSLIPQSPSF